MFATGPKKSASTVIFFWGGALQGDTSAYYKISIFATLVIGSLMSWLEYHIQKSF